MQGLSVFWDTLQGTCSMDFTQMLQKYHNHGGELDKDRTGKIIWKILSHSCSPTLPPLAADAIAA